MSWQCLILNSHSAIFSRASHGVSSGTRRGKAAAARNQISEQKRGWGGARSAAGLPVCVCSALRVLHVLCVCAKCVPHVLCVYAPCVPHVLCVYSTCAACATCALCVLHMCCACTMCVPCVLSVCSTYAACALRVCTMCLPFVKFTFSRHKIRGYYGPALWCSG